MFFLRFRQLGSPRWLSWGNSHVPYMGTQEPLIWICCITRNWHICVIHLILYLRPQKASTFQTYLQAWEVWSNTLTCKLWSCNLETTPYFWTIHPIVLQWTWMDKQGWAIFVWGRCSDKKAGWTCGRSWIKWHFSDEEGGTNGDFLCQIVIYINHVVEADES